MFLFVISPSKTQDFSAQDKTQAFSLPVCLPESETLIKALRKLSASELSNLMQVSEKIAELNYERYKKFDKKFTQYNAKQALLAFKGDVYMGFSLDSYLPEDFAFAQKHARILSGLYGILRPLDLIQPYRLEMKTKLKNHKGEDLYAFWGDKLAKLLEQQAKEIGAKVLVNLASQEYFKALPKKSFRLPVLEISFQEVSQGKGTVVGLFAKRARGLMSDFIIRNRLTEVESLKSFALEGYLFDADRSTDMQWVFSRPKRS